MCKQEAQAPFACEIHDLKIVYLIEHQSCPLSLAKDAGYLRSGVAQDRQHELFWFPGKNGRPDVSLKVYSERIEAYADAGQFVMVESVSEADEIIRTALVAATQAFIEQQHRRGVYIVLGVPKTEHPSGGLAGE